MTTHEIKCPFHSWGFGEEDGWAPGCRVETGEEYAGHAFGEATWRKTHTYMADAWGQMVIREVQRVSITGFEDRIFYVRTWRDPDGVEFGKKGLKCKGARAFARMLKGWRHPFYMDGELVNALESP